MPIWVELRRYATHPAQRHGFLDYLDAQYRSEHLGFPAPILENYLLHKGPAVIVFDGLDEIFETRCREHVTQQIEGFARRFPHIRILLTTRPLGYRRSILANAGFDHLALADLTRQQIGNFVHGWSRHTCPTDTAEAIPQRLLKAIDSSSALAELAANPLLLTILASLARHEELPGDRVTVLAHAIAVMVEHWDTAKLLHQDDNDPVRDLDHHDKLRLLQLAARQMYTPSGGTATGNYCPATVLISLFRNYLTTELALPADHAVRTARTMLHRFDERNALLAHLGAQVYGFIHRAFLDYLAAADLVQRLHEATLTDQDLADLFSRHASDPDWNQVLTLTTDMLPPTAAATVVAAMLNHDDDTLDHDPEGSNNYLVSDHVVHGIAVLKHVLTDPDAEPALSCHRATITAGIVRLLADSVQADLWRMWNCTRGFTLQPLRSSQAWIDRPQYLAWYQQYFDSSDFQCVPADIGVIPDYSYTWHTAADLYLDLQPHDQHTLTRFTDCTDAMLANLALQRIIDIDPDHPDTFALLLRHATDNPVADCRCTAVNALGRHWAHHPLARAQIRARIDDPDSDVRSGALHQLVANWPNDDAALPAVASALTDDPSVDVREQMIELIGHTWPADPTTVITLADRALHDGSCGVRLDALTMLITLLPLDDNRLYTTSDAARADEEEDIAYLADRTCKQIASHRRSSAGPPPPH